MMTATGSAIGQFARQKTVLLTTSRRDGTPVGPPVSIALDGERAFVRTYQRAGKLKRIRRSPEVEIAPSTWRDRPTGPTLLARAKVLDGAEASHAARLLAAKYPLLHGLLVPAAHRLMRDRTVHLELRAIAG